jgi:protein-disulfide isomerase
MALEFFEPSLEFKEKVEQIVAKNADKIQYFKADFGLVGIGVISKNYRKMVFYTNDNVDFLFSGVLLDAKKMANLSNENANELDMDLSGIVSQVSQLNGIEQGTDDGDEIYAVIDVNCGYCHKTWEQIQAIYSMNPNSKFKVHWIPVGFLGQDSVNKARSILSENENKEAFTLLNQGMNRQQVNVPVEKKSLGTDKVNKNETFMKSNGFGGVPLVIAKVDNKWNMYSGKPSNSFFQRLREKNIREIVSQQAEKSE